MDDTPATVDEAVPPPPRPPYFDHEAGAWVLSRYADVLAAFTETRLWPVTAKGEDHGNGRAPNGSLLHRAEVRDALTGSKLAAWEHDLTAFAEATLGRVSAEDEFELLSEFAKPCCLPLAIAATGAAPADSERLAALGDHVFAATGAPPESQQKLDGAAATERLKAYFEASPVPMAQATFVGVSQTLPRLIVSGWLALLQRPSEVARLRATPELKPRAVEELMRVAGIIPRLFRRAQADVELGSVRLAAGDRVTLMIASANRDPERFPDPNRLDISRRGSGQLALGIGHGSCAGARVVRMVSGATTMALINAFEEIDVTGRALWHSGSGFCWPTAVRVRAERNPRAIASATNAD
jgi:cytochrome P450